MAYLYVLSAINFNFYWRKNEEVAVPYPRMNVRQCWNMFIKPVQHVSCYLADGVPDPVFRPTCHVRVPVVVLSILSYSFPRQRRKETRIPTETRKTPGTFPSGQPRNNT